MKRIPVFFLLAGNFGVETRSNGTASPTNNINVLAQYLTAGSFGCRRLGYRWGYVGALVETPTYAF